MITFPYAKINLGLDIVHRRADGYHDIETVFYPIALNDVLEVVRDSETSLTCHGNPIDCPMEQNLVYKAWRLMSERYDVPPIQIHLYKHIPDGAGLGGGSSDAAFMLSMLNTMFELGLERQELAKMAATLGADCAYFLYRQPMFATGIGDRLEPIDVSLAGRSLLLVKPDVYVSTRDAYAGVVPMRPAVSLRERVALPLEQWQRTVVNAFEPTVFAAHPWLADIKQDLLDAGAVYAAMSGSGSSLFGIFDSDMMAEQARDKFAGSATFVMKL